MGDDLNCRFEVRAREGSRYWFPLLYDLCIGHGLRLVSPYSTPELYGRYLYSKDFDVESADGSFKDMWDKIYAGFDIGITFWFNAQESGLEYGDIGLYLDWKETEAQLGILLSTSGANFRFLTLERATWLMTTIVELCKKIYLLCEPFEAEIYWDNSSGRFPAWATFSEVPKLANDAMRTHIPTEMHLLSNIFGNGKLLLLLDPVAIARDQRKWEFVSIAKDLTGEVQEFDVADK